MYYIATKNDTNYLIHHGIKGQKWGVRRYQYADGSLTEAGHKRHATDIQGAKDRLSDKKAKFEKVKNTSNVYVYNKAKKELNWARKDLKNEKIKEKLNKETKKSNHRLELEKKYLEKGMSQEEAEIAAYKRAKTEKMLAIAGGVAVASVAAYVAYKHYDRYVDKIIKPGMTMHNISTNSNKGVKDAFYAADNALDRMKYRGWYGGNQLGGMAGKNKIYDTTFKAKSSLKVASEKSGFNVLKNMIESDPQYKQELTAYLKDTRHPLVPAISRGYEDLKKGKITSNVFEAVNTNLVDHTPTGEKMSKKFYDSLKKAGYDAITDIHDKKNSGYNTINPYIVFGGENKLIVDSVKKLPVSQLKNDLGLATGAHLVTETLKLSVPVASIAGGRAGLSKVIESKASDKFVANYRKEHPNTKLTYNEILRFETR